MLKIAIIVCAFAFAGCVGEARSDAPDDDGVGGSDTLTGGSDAAGGSARGSGGQGEPLDLCAGFATEVVSVTYGPGAGFGQDEMPGIVLGAPHGAGNTVGSLDVVSLGNGGTITLGFGDQVIENVPGPDLIVFENAFFAGGDPDKPFAELATVEVSEDGDHWLTFPCTASVAPFGSCAGWHPVLAGSEGSPADPHDPLAAGGDAFDLADVGVDQVRFVRITDRPDTVGLSGSFDLDAIALVSWSCAER